MFKKVFDKLQSICWNVANRSYEYICRRRIRTKPFTIICYNCIGGIIYHRLGMKFLSPTVNLYESQHDFWKLVENLEYYMSQEITPIESDRGYPVVKLDDITLFCNHFHSIEEFYSAWNARKNRIIWDNLFLIIYDSPEVTEERLANLERLNYKKYIILTNKVEKKDVPHYKYISPSNKGRADEHVFFDCDYFGLRTFEKQWDFVGWLNE